MAISELDLPTGVIAHSSADAQRQAELMADSVARRCATRYRHTASQVWWYPVGGARLGSSSPV